MGAQKLYKTKTGVVLTVHDGGGESTPRVRGHLKLVDESFVPPEVDPLIPVDNLYAEHVTIVMKAVSNDYRLILAKVRRGKYEVELFKHNEAVYFVGRATNIRQATQLFLKAKNDLQRGVSI